MLRICGLDSVTTAIHLKYGAKTSPHCTASHLFRQLFGGLMAKSRLCQSVKVSCGTLKPPPLNFFSFFFAVVSWNYRCDMQDGDGVAVLRDAQVNSLEHIKGCRKRGWTYAILRMKLNEGVRFLGWETKAGELGGASKPHKLNITKFSLCKLCACV